MKWGSRVKALTLVLSIVLLAGVSACAARSQPAADPAPIPVPTNQVAVNASSFDPPDALVTVGTAVTWTNRDEVSYFIAENGQTFAFNLAAGGAFSLTFTDPGTYNYHCSGHPEMQGTITVVPGASARTGTSGELHPESAALRNSSGNG